MPETAIDMVATMARQRLLHATFGKQLNPEPVFPKKAPKFPKVWVCMEDTQIVLAGSGAMQIKKYQRIDNIAIVTALKDRGADIRPIE